MNGVCLNVLVIDDEEKIRDNMAHFLIGLGHQPTTAASGFAALALPTEKLRQVDVAIIDYIMPEKNGFETAKELLDRNSKILTIMLTAHADLPHQRKAFLAGFSDYIPKPFTKDDVAECFRGKKISRLMQFKQFFEANCLEVGKNYCLMGSSPVATHLKAYIEKAAATSYNVLITGESGTGKEMVANLVHNLSDRKDKPFVGKNCAGNSPLVASELFGCRKGAFTGAFEHRAGLFEQANGGTVFLDEIGDMPLDQQALLLRTLQEKTVVRLGEVRERSVDFRLIAATNADLKESVAKKEFREDLYYRLNALWIEIPPLRKRREDIPGFVDFFLKKIDAGNHIEIPGHVLERFYKSDWPGNLRELQNAIIKGAVYDDWTQVLNNLAEASSIGVNPMLPSDEGNRAGWSHEIVLNKYGQPMLGDRFDGGRLMADIAEKWCRKELTKEKAAMELLGNETLSECCRKYLSGEVKSTPQQQAKSMLTQKMDTHEVVSAILNTPIEDARKRWGRLLSWYDSRGGESPKATRELLSSYIQS